MSILTRALHRLGHKVLAACLPNCCLLCGTDSESLLCPACIADLPSLPAGRCPLCAEPTSRGERCGHCLTRAPHFDGTIALYRYDFPVDRLIHAFKYGGQLALAGWLGHRLGDALTGHACDRIIPMPLHPARLKQRGFNQSGEIARAVSRRLRLPLDLSSCRRSRSTSPQAELPLKERGANVRGAFECVADLSGQSILLIDDVMTSGATLNECARVLKLHGAARVDAAVVARAVQHAN